MAIRILIQRLRQILKRQLRVNLAQCIQGGSGANTDEHNAYRAAIRREIERHKRYPARAKMMRKQGIVNVSFSVGADGSLSGERIAKSSGDEA